jgi:Txe/YoeB family toxin of Txe-Axe toxin-antitoxin module
MKIRISCEDKYEAQKLSSLLFIKDANDTFITAILNIVGNELVVALKDKSAHSIILKDETYVEKFADFIQSVIDKEHKIVSTVIVGQDVEIVKE